MKNLSSSGLKGLDVKIYQNQKTDGDWPVRRPKLRVLLDLRRWLFGLRQRCHYRVTRRENFVATKQQKEEISVGLSLMLYAAINSRWIVDLNIKVQTNKRCLKKIQCLHDHRGGHNKLANRFLWSVLSGLSHQDTEEDQLLCQLADRDRRARSCNGDRQAQQEALLCFSVCHNCLRPCAVQLCLSNYPDLRQAGCFSSACCTSPFPGILCKHGRKVTLTTWQRSPTAMVRCCWWTHCVQEDDLSVAGAENCRFLFISFASLGENLEEYLCSFFRAVVVSTIALWVWTGNWRRKYGKTEHELCMYWKHLCVSSLIQFSQYTGQK